VPQDLRPLVGRIEVTKSLKTDSLELAVLRSQPFKAWIEKARKAAANNSELPLTELDAIEFNWIKFEAVISNTFVQSEQNRPELYFQYHNQSKANTSKPNLP
jgi:hypothetical protein